MDDALSPGGPLTITDAQQRAVRALAPLLAYFGEADAAPLPRGLSHRRWEELKQRLRARVVDL